ncbi:hypothetical protein [Streptomyces sp. NRRL F-4489]|uniref:hypothetical protein n=1 Tax=Streptomyces sp. NRRL F-4489 TaxID=1609095 RepID=UPI000ADB25F8|nr:hypothetical protein [Streptomyces sp. NRRL F-4489]
MWLIALLIPVGLLGLGTAVFAIWAYLGTDRPVEHHSSMPSKPSRDLGAGW